VVAHRCFKLPRSSALCGCINIPGRQVNAVWGRCPTACTMYVKKKLGVCCWGLVDKISPAFELRNPGVPAVVVLACRVPAGLVARRVPAVRVCVAPPPPARCLAGGGSTVVCFVPPPLCRPQLGPFFACFVAFCFRTTVAAHLCVAPPRQSTAYTCLKQPWPPL
jgi:hypothetical protein